MERDHPMDDGPHQGSLGGIGLEDGHFCIQETVVVVMKLIGVSCNISLKLIQ